MRFFQPIYEQCSDEELMRLIAENDERAFDEIYRRYSDRMLRYFWRMLNQDEEKSQDFLQDLMMKVVEKAHLFNAERRFSTWVYSVASNMCKNEYRSQAVRRVMTRLDDHTEINALELPDEGQIDRKSFEKQLEVELDNLSDNHREVFVLRYQEDLSIKEIGEVMACSEGTVKSRIFYALRKLATGLHAFNPKNEGQR
ncbi:MAG: RNA polymerase sigma factor [Bacteroidia bacterium]